MSERYKTFILFAHQRKRSWFYKIYSYRGCIYIITGSSGAESITQADTPLRHFFLFDVESQEIWDVISPV
jgi:hypothetical protein